MNKDFLRKECVKTFSFTTANKNRSQMTETVINGRKYLKMGDAQAVTVVGNMYKIFNNETGKLEYWLYAGMSKQNPVDRKNDKEIGYEEAQINALNNPFWTMKVTKEFGERTFRYMMTSYINNLKLDYVLTNEEIKLHNK